MRVPVGIALPHTKLTSALTFVVTASSLPSFSALGISLVTQARMNKLSCAHLHKIEATIKRYLSNFKAVAVSHQSYVSLVFETQSKDVSLTFQAPLEVRWC
jgi:hypothetical protein